MYKEFLAPADYRVLRKVFSNIRLRSKGEPFGWTDLDHFLSTVTNRPDDSYKLTKLVAGEPWGPLNWQWAQYLTKAKPLAEHNHIVIEYNGESKTLVEWAKVLGCTPNAIYKRIFCYKWPVERALGQPVRTKIQLDYGGRTQTLVEWAKELKLDYHTLYSRLARSNWAVEEVFKR